MMDEIVIDLYFDKNFVFVCRAVLAGLRHSIQTNVAASHLAWRDRCRAAVVQCQMVICRDVLLHDVRRAAALICRPAWFSSFAGVRWLGL